MNQGDQIPIEQVPDADLSADSANQAKEYQAYRAAADNAFQDSIRAYESMDRWMLSLSGGAFAVCTALATNSSLVPPVFYAGIALFAFSTSILLYSKYKSYTTCEDSMNVIEEIYRESPGNFSSEHWNTVSKKVVKFNQTNEIKNRIGLWTFIAGISLVTAGVMPLDWCSLFARRTNGISNTGAAETNPASASTPTSSASQGASSSLPTSTLDTP